MLGVPKGWVNENALGDAGSSRSALDDSPVEQRDDPLGQAARRHVIAEREQDRVAALAPRLQP